MSDQKRVIHYLNQFFGQVGGEDQAYQPLMLKEGAVGPGQKLSSLLESSAKVAATIVVGDNYAVENEEEIREEIYRMLKKHKADLIIAGPAFAAGRYGLSCRLALEAADEAGVLGLAGMHPDNPAADMYRGDGYIAVTSDKAAQMKEALENMADLTHTLLSGEDPGSPETGGYVPRGVRKNVRTDQTGAERGVDMLLAKIKGRPFETEYRMPVFTQVAPSAPVKDLTQAKIAVMTTGGIVPKGNPDGLEACFATKYARYELSDLKKLSAVNCESVHGGYDPTYANEEPNRVLPVDALRQLKEEGEIGTLYPSLLVTVGNGMAVQTASRLGVQMAEELKADGVDGVILTST